MDREDSAIREEYHELVRDIYGNVVREVNSHYPSRLSIRFDWEDIKAFDEAIAEQCLRDPERARECIGEAIECWTVVDMPEAVVRVHNIPDEYHFRVGKQRTLHLGRLITVEGEVIEMEGVKPFSREAALQCHRCGTMHYLPQTYGRMMEPAECEGCERSGNIYVFQREQSDLIDYRKIILQRSETNLDDDLPILVAYLTQDLVDRIGPGDYVSLVGYYDTGMVQKKSVLQTFLDTWDIESHEEGILADRLSPAELSEAIVEEVEARQSEDSSSFGANRDEVVATIVEEGVREKEVEAQFDELIEEKRVSAIGGGKVMVT